ncbi:Chromatin remodeling protein SHL like [Verticillium longisporum]|uniref:Chromatin remodeling protein SHL like n=1 Tax=Verticillium longisporum TaxID=100787 RepID=A0A8I3AS63_VERLO|nr:Chromatin remodeling protein SHL like [Verticillium longisporum]
MSASPRKRSRAEPAEDTKAECPFEVKYESEDVKTKARKAAKRRKQAQQLGGAVGADADEDEIAKVQPSPFTPSGSFKNDENMDLRYWVEPRDKWMAMTRYNSFVLNSAKYFSEGFIYISNGMASPTNNQVKVDENGVRQRMPNEWVGRILEIRAADEHHVYARIYWMYWPEELPVQTKDDGKFVARAGRQPYHGVNELIASNHMDVINVVSVTAEAKVKQWFEENDDEIQDGLYWRQALDVRTLSLSSVHRTCKCKQPANPDKTLVACSQPNCSTWLHDECLKHDALMRTFAALGTDQPYIAPPPPPPPPAAAENGETDGSKLDQETGRPLSPPDNGVEVQQSIDAKPGASPEAEAAAKERLSTPRGSSARGGGGGQGTPTVGTITAAPGSLRKTKVPKRGKASAARPYEGLFEATLKVAENVVEIRDLRANVTGGVKVWTEPLVCLVCHTTIS